MRDDTNSPAPHVCESARVLAIDIYILFYFIGIRTVNTLKMLPIAACRTADCLMILMKLFGQRFIYHLVKSKLSTQKNKSCTRHRRHRRRHRVWDDFGFSAFVKVLLMHLVIRLPVPANGVRYVCSGSTLAQLKFIISHMCSCLIRNKIKYT